MMVLRKLKKLDKPILFVLGCLVTIGILAIHGATSGTRLHGIHWNYLFLFGLFCIPMLLIAILDYRIILGKMSYALYGVGIGLLIIVQWIGENINGAVRWLSIGQFQIQPSELMKVATVCMAAVLLQRREGQPLRFYNDLLPVFLVFLVPILFILEQPDLGTALVFVGIFLCMIWIGNVRARHIFFCMGILIAVAGALLWSYSAMPELLSKIVKPHQMSRIQSFLDPSSDADKSWHVKNAMNAIRSGGLFGDTGFYVQQGYVPYAYSDSIYVVIGEKYGFIGSAVLLLLFFILIFRMVMVVIVSEDLAGSYLVFGLMGMFVFQIFVNIGMHIGLLPFTGLSLPFISYGGSFLLTNMLAIGLVLSVKIHSDSSLTPNHCMWIT